MKKCAIVWLVAALLLCCVPALGEETPASCVVTIDEALDLSFALPEGYMFSENWFGGILYAEFDPADSDAASMILSVGVSEEYSGRSIGDLSEEEMETLKELAAEDFSNPSIAVTETAHGTKLILADENSEYDEYAEIFTVYQGYFIGMLIQPQNGAPLTESEIQVAVDVLSGMEFVNK